MDSETARSFASTKPEKRIVPGLRMTEKDALQTWLEQHAQAGGTAPVPASAPAAGGPKRRVKPQPNAKAEFQGYLEKRVHKMEWLPVATDWGYDNTILGFNRSTAKKVNDDVVARMQRGEVKQMRPGDARVGRNIKYCARHSASLCCISPNYGELDPVRAQRQNRTMESLARVAHLKEATPEADWMERAKLNSTLGRGAYGPYGSSVPHFLECIDNVLVQVPQPGA